VSIFIIRAQARNKTMKIDSDPNYRMKVAAYQTPLAACRALDALPLIREQIHRCETIGAELLCCPEGVLGGLADYVDRPTSIAIDVEAGRLNEILAPLASDTVTTILGFTEVDRTGRLYNAAAVFHRGAVIGVYRKLHPAINRSVYEAGHETPVFTVGALTFGIVICRDSTFPEPARVMAARGATALFVPTNNGMPPAKGGPELITDARNGDIARATENCVSVIRADVAGRAPDLVSYGSSGIVNHEGTVLGSARPLEADLVVAEIDVAPRGGAS
jgi:predicted amidohydrolase